MKFIIGTTSDIKLNAAKKVIRDLLGNDDFKLTGCEADSGVSDTPRNEETLSGARSRAYNCQQQHPDADFWIGLESGLVERYNTLFEEVWVCAISSDQKELLGISSALKVPDYLIREMQEKGEEHRETMRRLRTNPEGPKDTWGDYTGGTLLRTTGMEEALRNSLIQKFCPPYSYYQK
jgi:non-canonical (house-cleaning) NTP pyrophosphatase